MKTLHEEMFCLRHQVSSNQPSHISYYYVDDFFHFRSLFAPKKAGNCKCSTQKLGELKKKWFLQLHLNIRISGFTRNFRSCRSIPLRNTRFLRDDVLVLQQHFDTMVVFPATPFQADLRGFLEVFKRYFTCLFCSLTVIICYHCHYYVVRMIRMFFNLVHVVSLFA